MPIDTSETADLLIADRGEAILVSGQQVTGVFVRTKMIKDDDAVGESIPEAASLRFPAGTVTLVRDQIITRVADSTEWMVETVDTKYGRTVAQLSAARRQTVGFAN